MSRHRPFPRYRYIRTNRITGESRYCERGFLSKIDFLGHLSLWNRTFPSPWKYETARPVTHVGWASDTETVQDHGVVEP